MSDVTPPTDPALQALPVDPLLGTKIGEYEVLAHLAEGGMGVVYRGVHPLIKKRVAIKVLKPVAGKSATHLAQLTAEAEAVNSIGHRNIVDIFGMGLLPDGRPYIIMEYLEGKALDTYFEEHHHQLPLTEVVEILFEMCAPLAAAHKARVIHRDLKPSNVFLATQPDGTRFLKLLDFGLAKKALGLDGVTEQTSQKSIAGTPTFMAPEHAQGKAISPRTDLYALGCIGYFLLTGKLPFDGQTPMDVMIAHVRAPVPRVSAMVEVPHELDELLFWLMAKSPDDRPQSADQVRDVLRGVLEALGAPVGVPGATHLDGATRTSGARPLPQDGGPVPVNTPAGGRPRASNVNSGRPRVTGERPVVNERPRVTGERQALRPEPPQAAPKRSLVVPALAGLVAVLAVAVFFVTRAGADKATAQNGTTQNDTTQNGTTQNGTTQNGTTQNGTTQNGTTQNDTTQNDTAPNGTQNDATQNDTTQNDTTQNGTTQNDTTQNDTTQNDTTQNDTAHQDDSELDDDLTPLPPGVTKRVDAKPAPSQKDLKARVAALEKRLKAKEDPDPAALQHLARYRVQATIAESAADRARLSRQLDQWERLFLR